MPWLLTVALVCLAVQPLCAADRWVMQFFHDEDKSELTINDLQFASPTRGVAIGFLAEKRKVTPTAVVTSDAGKTWSLVTTKEIGISLFFLNDQSGWMVTEGGIWSTDEAGRSWKKIYKHKALRKVYFLNAEHGWALGGNKTILETMDGGKTWEKVKAAEDLNLNTERTAFTWMDFGTPNRGIVVGGSHPLLRRLPTWMQTEKKQELPHISVFLETKDGGKTWEQQSASLFGEVTRFRLGKNGRGLALLSYENFFDWPSEVLRLDLTTGKNFTSLRTKDRAITDVALMSDGSGYAAGFEPSGIITYSPVPGPVKIMRSQNLTTWDDMKVDYRAVAHRVMIAAVDATHVWVATDTGMILKLVSN